MAIYFTCDIDWASEDVVNDTISIFKDYSVPCTLFATHRSERLLSLSDSLFEIGLHPNFNNLLQGSGGNPKQIMHELMQLYPQATGVRSHSLTQNGWLLQLFKDLGFQYESNHFLPYFKSVEPFKLWNGLIRVPFNWEDDYHYALGKSFDSLDIPFFENNIVLNFHPIHIYLNTEVHDRYLNAKTDLGNTKMLSKHVNRGSVKGTRDLLISLLEDVSRRNIQTGTLGSFCKDIQF